MTHEAIINSVPAQERRMNENGEKNDENETFSLPFADVRHKICANAKDVPKTDAEKIAFKETN